MPAAIAKEINDLSSKQALQDCQELLSDAIDQLSASFRLPNREIKAKIDDLRTWLSAALTDQDTCLDSLEETGGGLKEKMDLILRNSTVYLKNSLAIAAHVVEILP